MQQLFAAIRKPVPSWVPTLLDKAQSLVNQQMLAEANEILQQIELQKVTPLTKDEFDRYLVLKRAVVRRQEEEVRIPKQPSMQMLNATQQMCETDPATQQAGSEGIFYDCQEIPPLWYNEVCQEDGNQENTCLQRFSQQNVQQDFRGGV